MKCTHDHLERVRQIYDHSKSSASHVCCLMSHVQAYQSSHHPMQDFNLWFEHFSYLKQILIDIHVQLRDILTSVLLIWVFYYRELKMKRSEIEFAVLLLLFFLFCYFVMDCYVLSCLFWYVFLVNFSRIKL